MNTPSFYSKELPNRSLGEVDKFTYIGLKIFVIFGRKDNPQ